MSNFVTIQTQLGSVVEIIAKAAAAEINRCVDESCAVFRLEITHSQKEIEALKHKLQVLESELLKTRKQKTASSHSVVEHSLCSDKGFEQEWRFRRREGEDRTVVADVNTHLQPCFTKDQCRSDGHPTNHERLEEVCYGDKHLRSSAEDQVTQTIRVEDGKKLDTEPTHVGDPEVLRCGLGDEELSGLEFVVKAEQEEEHVAQRLNQTGCQLSAGRLNNLKSEYVKYERDNQLWTSFAQANSGIESNEPVSSNATEQCSQSLSIYFPIQHTTATMEVSGNTLSSFGDSYAEEFDEMGDKPFACSEELRSEAIHTQQGQYRERLVHTVERENQTLLPQQQKHGPAVKHRRGSESPAQAHSGSQYETGSALGTGAVNAEKGKVDGQVDSGKRLYTCTTCSKSFTSCITLTSHQRVHTVDKPYSCTRCGQSFSRKDNLVHHERVHSGYRPFGCPLCGKRFARGTHLRQHQRTHTKEGVHHCTQCERSFSHRCNLVVHQRSHGRVKPHNDQPH